MIWSAVKSLRECFTIWKLWIQNKKVKLNVVHVLVIQIQELHKWFLVQTAKLFKSNQNQTVWVCVKPILTKKTACDLFKTYKVHTK